MAICTTCGNDLAEGASFCTSCGTAVAVAAAARNEGPQLELARFPRRAIGLLIDVSIMVALGFIPYLWGYILLLWPVVWVAFNSIGWSPGKWLLGMRIVQENGKAPGFGRAVVRTLAFAMMVQWFGIVPHWVSGLMGVVGLLGLLSPLWDEERQTWHDKFAGTHVVIWSDGYAIDVQNALTRSAEEAVPGGPFGDSARTVPAEFMIRWGGYILDAWLYNLVVIPLAAFLFNIMSYDINSDSSWSHLFLAFALILSLHIALVSVFNSLGWSPGKRALDLRLIDRMGRRPGPRRGIIRGLGTLVSNPVLWLPIGYLWALWEDDNRTWHDQIAKTRVIRRIPRRPARWK